MRIKNYSGLLAKIKTFKQITSYAQSAKEGDLFVALEGATPKSQDGHDFIYEAVQNGVDTILGSKPLPENITLSSTSFSYIQVPDARKAFAELSADFYDYPSTELLVIGITGTSGKTTTSYILESILREAGHSVGVIGTNEIRSPLRTLESSHTTPDAQTLHKLLRQFKIDGCTAVVMEVSSHALKQERVWKIAFDGLIFTNLTSEHLDYHLGLEDYFNSKVILFDQIVHDSISQGKRPLASIGIDDAFGKRLFKMSKEQNIIKRVRSFSVLDGQATFSQNGISAVSPNFSFESSLVGQFNYSNLLGAASLCNELGILQQHIEMGINKLAQVPGRMQNIGSSDLTVLVDYAHKPDALEKVLQTLLQVKPTNGKLICVFGCGGDRDRTKRSVMGGIAVKNANVVFITSDNPRTEDPYQIIAEIAAGTKDVQNSLAEVVNLEPDRRKAITAAIRSASPGDIILIAGKGHETYQITGKIKTPFDDREVAKEALTYRFGKPAL